MHRHRPKTTRDVCYSHPVATPPNPAAHGNIMEIATHRAALLLDEIEHIIVLAESGLEDEAAIAILRLIDSHAPNPDDPTSCGHCGMADGCYHIEGCPCGEHTPTSTVERAYRDGAQWGDED
jgi:hypothetical protein